MQRMVKRIFASFLSLVILISFCGCAEKEPEGEVIKLYVLNHAGTKLETKDYVLGGDMEDITALVEEIIYELGKEPEDLSYIAPLGQGFVINSFDVLSGKIDLDMSMDYLELDPGREVLTRAALVKTLTQLDGINYVSIKVNGNALRDALGFMVGIMSADSFIDNENSQINPMAETKLRLYFADETGSNLVAIDRTLTYNTNMSLERLILEQLLLGPAGELENVYPTLGSETAVLNVTIKDNICYVNLSEGFLSQLLPTTPEITVYSIVNSLVELPGVNKVQISVNGESSVMYMETISLATPFERNLDLVKAKE